MRSISDWYVTWVQVEHAAEWKFEMSPSLWGVLRIRVLDYHLLRQGSVALDGPFLYPQS